MTGDERRLLELLAASDDGCTDALLSAHGFKLDVLISIVSAEFATVTPERTFAAGKPVEITRVKITDAGRRALGDQDFPIGNITARATAKPSASSPQASRSRSRGCGSRTPGGGRYLAFKMACRPVSPCGS